MPHRRTPTGAWETYPLPPYPIGVDLDPLTYAAIGVNYGVYPDWAVGALHEIFSGRVAVSFLILGGSYGGDKPRQGMYYLSVARRTDAMDADLRHLVGLVGQNQAGQLALANRLIAPRSHEYRDKILGWSFREI